VAKVILLCAETCPVITEGGTRRFQLVREGGGRGGGGSRVRYTLGCGREGVLNNLAQTGYQTTELNQMGTQNPRRVENTAQTANKPRPGASSRATAQHARKRPTARQDRQRLHHWDRERRRGRESPRCAHARGDRGRGRGHRSPAPAPEGGGAQQRS